MKLPNLPLNCWSDNSLSRIGSVLGIPIYAHECTTKVLRVSFSRILVEMDVTKAIPQKTLAVENLLKKWCMSGSHHSVKPAKWLGLIVMLKERLQLSLFRNGCLTWPSTQGGKECPTSWNSGFVDNSEAKDKEETNTIFDDGVLAEDVDLSWWSSLGSRACHGYNTC